MNILDRIIATKRAEVAAARTIRPLEEMIEAARRVTRPTVSLANALTTSKTGIIAEFKRRSPSRGVINPHSDVTDVVTKYATRGAAAISVLTDEQYFGGTTSDLSEARSAVDGTAQRERVPILRKEFVVDEWQICEARTAGADAVLLIAAAITPHRCGELAEFAAGMGLEVLLEVHYPGELDHLCAGVAAVGVNNRDLGTFEVDAGRSETMAELLPAGMVKVSESGISDAATVRRLRNRGFEGFLMGENFMRHADPGAALAEFVKELSNESIL